MPHFRAFPEIHPIWEGQASHRHLTYGLKQLKLRLKSLDQVRRDRQAAWENECCKEKIVGGDRFSMFYFPFFYDMPF